MNKSNALKSLVDEVNEPVSELKSGDTVQFKKGSGPDGGLQGYLVDKNSDGTWNMKVGNATRVSVKETDLETVSNSHNVN